MECSLHDSMVVFDNRVTVGEVQYFHVSEAVLTIGQIDMPKLDTVGRIGGPDYTVSEPIGVSRREYY